MSELEEKLENILGNPQAMAQIMSLAQSLNLGGSGQPAGGTDAPPPQPQEQPPDGAPAPAPSAGASSQVLPVPASKCSLQ